MDIRLEMIENELSRLEDDAGLLYLISLLTELVNQNTRELEKVKSTLRNVNKILISNKRSEIRLKMEKSNEQKFKQTGSR